MFGQIPFALVSLIKSGPAEFVVGRFSPLL
jgi:hypothetical protein